MKISERCRLGLCLQLNEIEKASKIKLVGEILDPDELGKKLGSAFEPMEGADIENLKTFLYQELYRHNKGLLVFVDGGAPSGRRLTDGVDFRSLMAKHVAYFSILPELLQDRIVNLDNMLMEVEFNNMINGVLSFSDSKSLRDRLSAPYVLIINDVNGTVINSFTTYKDEKGGERENVFAEERLVIFMDQLLGERLADRKITIFTFLDTYDEVCSSSKKLGTRLDESLARLAKAPNGFEAPALQAYKCCRVCLVTKSMAENMKSRDVERRTKVESIFKKTGCECANFPKLMDDLKDACTSLGTDADDVFRNLTPAMARCMEFGEPGKEAVRCLLDIAARSPKTLAILLGSGK